MNDGEKEAIEKFENLLTKHFEDKKIDTVDYLDYFEGITILNLIDKQQKEIEDLRLDLIENWVHKNMLNSYISKDKIKEKIKELEDMPENQYIHLHYIKKILKELLGE